MSRRKSIVGVLAVCALCMAAFSAANASASTWERCEAKGKGGGTGVLWNAGCTATETGGPNETYPLANGVPTPVTITGTSNFVLSSLIGGVAFNITCTGFTSVGATASNSESGGVMNATGTGKLKLTGCSVTKPAGGVCTVPSTLETVEMAFKAEGTSIRFAAASGGTIITIPVSGASCPAALKGEKAINGFAKSAEKTMVTQAFTTTSGSALTYGGQAETLTGEYHIKVNSSGAFLGVGTP